MNKVQPITCVATSDLEVSIPDTQGRHIVLYFYPKDSTSGCTTEGQDFRDNHQAFIDANTLIYGVSRDSLKSHENFKAKQNFPFELSDYLNIKYKTLGLLILWEKKKVFSHWWPIEHKLKKMKFSFGKSLKEVFVLSWKCKTPRAYILFEL